MKIIIKDGVKYLPYEFTSEDELEQIVKSQIDFIFDDNSLFFGKATIKSISGIRTIPDGFILLPDVKKWYIVEIELSSHPIYAHIFKQIDKFKNAIKNPTTKNKLITDFYDKVKSDTTLNKRIESLISGDDIHKVISDTIDKTPSIIIIIDNKTDKAKEICDSLPFKTEILEFSTYSKEKEDLKDTISIFDTLTSYDMKHISKKKQQKLKKEEFRITGPKEETTTQEINSIVGKGCPPGYVVMLINELHLKVIEFWLQLNHAEPDRNGQWTHSHCSTKAPTIERYIYAIAVPSDKMTIVRALFKDINKQGLLIKDNINIVKSIIKEKIGDFRITQPQRLIRL